MKKIVLLLSVLVLLMLGFNVYLLVSHEKIVYVDLGELQDNYKLKKDLEEKAKGTLLMIKNAIDSFSMIKKMEGAGSRNTGVDTSIVRLQYEFQRYYNESNVEISNKIWDRLNPVIEKYGKEHNYSVIVGANGAGTVLYGEKRYDVTDDLIKYINADYEKGH